MCSTSTPKRETAASETATSDDTDEQQATATATRLAGPPRKKFTPEELKVCLRVLRIIVADETDEPEIEEVRTQLAGIAKAAHRRNRRKERGANGGEAARHPAQAPPPAAAEATAEGVVRVPAAFLSRPLYPKCCGGSNPARAEDPRLACCCSPLRPPCAAPSACWRPGCRGAARST